MSRLEPTQKSMIENFLGMGQAELRKSLVSGFPIDPRSLDDVEYKGISLGLPGFIDKLAWKTFMKVFHRDPATGRLRGWNVRLQQTGVYGECIPKKRGGAPVTWGHYLVVAEDEPKMVKAKAPMQLLDYGQGGNARYDIFTNAIRDPLVAIQEGTADFLLGWSYLQFGPLRVPTPSYFLLVREGTLSHVAHPSRKTR